MIAKLLTINEKNKLFPSKTSTRWGGIGPSSSGSAIVLGKYVRLLLVVFEVEVKATGTKLIFVGDAL